MTTYKLIIDNNEYYIANSDTLAITMQTQDFRDLNTARKRTISKTIDIYGTPEINKAFSNIWDIKFTSTANLAISFNHLKFKPCSLYENDAPFLDGGIILKRVIIKNNVIKYEFVFTNLELVKFKELETLMINQLSAFEKYNHILKHSNIIDTWSGYNQVNGYRVNLWGTSPIVPDGKGYFYPLGFYGKLTQHSATVSDTQITNCFNTTKLIPSFFVREILLEVFNYLNINIDISDFDGEFFKNLFISGCYEQFKANIEGTTIAYNSQLDDNSIAYERTLDNMNKLYITQGYPPVSKVNRAWFEDSIQNILTNVSNNDLSAYNSGYYIAPRKGKLRISLNLSADITGDSWAYQEVTSSFKVLRNGTQQGLTLNTQIYYNQSAYTADINKYLELDVNTGDVISIVYGFSLYTCYDEITTLKFTLKTPATIDFDISYTSYGYGDMVNMVDWLPKMKATDFVNGIINMFNLYVSEINENSIVLCKYESYYHDWSTQIRLDEYIDVSKEFEVVPMAIEHNLKSLELNYKQPNDFLNNDYKTYTGKQWGSKVITLDTDIATDTKKYDLPFSLILPQEIDAYPLLIIPTIYNFKNSEYDVCEFEPMLSIYNGVQFVTVDLYDYNANTATWVHSSNNTYPVLSNNYYNFTPPFSDRLNLCYEYPAATYYDNTVIELESNITIFNRYFESDLNDIINIDAKCVRCEISTIALNTTDLLRKVYTIDGALFRCNKILDYNSNNSTVKIELIKKLDITRDPVYIQPIAPIKPSQNVATASVRSASYDTSTETATGLRLNELFIDIAKKIVGIGGVALITGVKSEYVGKITQTGTNDPTLSDVVKSFDVAFTRHSAGIYLSNIPDTKVCNCTIEKQSVTETIVFMTYAGYYAISSGIDGKLSNHIIKIIKYK